MADTWRDKIALLLWRDRDGYDPATGTVGEQHNVSMRTRLRASRKRMASALLNGPLWLGILAGAFAVLAALLPGYVDRTKADQQVNAGAGELRLNCIQQTDGILICRPVGGAQDKVVTGANTEGLDSQRATASAAEK